MSAKRYMVHGTYIDDYSHTQTRVEMVMSSDYDQLRTALETARQVITLACGTKAPYARIALEKIDAALQGSAGDKHG